MTLLTSYNSIDFFGGYSPDKQGTEDFCNLLVKVGHNPDGKSIASRIFTDDEKKEIILLLGLFKAFPNWSAGNQAIGDCMSWSCSHTVDILMGVQAYLQQLAEETPYQVCSEAMYGFMRVEALGKTKDYGGDGAYGGAAAKAVMKCGTLHRKKYDIGKGYDFTTYSGSRAKAFGRDGVPDDLEPLAREHIVKTATLVTDFETAAKFITNGYPISNAHGSNPTLQGSRDKDGFARPGGFSHAMNYVGVRWGARPGLLKTNTGWKDTTGGPMYPDNLPKSILGCCWWEDADRCNMVLRDEDSFAYSQYNGFKKQDLPDFGTTSYL